MAGPTSPPQSLILESTDSNHSSSTASPETLLNHVTPEKKKSRAHFKSRRGCYDCKRRKIKCQETRPRCENCARLGLKCRYGTEIVVPSPSQCCTLNVDRSFSLTDMRLYHHFLNAAYPHFPVRSDNIWLRYIIPIGHQCEYLMHAMLALAASHLEKLAPTGLTSISQMHRLNAIKGLNSALDKPMKKAEDGDAAIAACYALYMQSWYMDDGLSASLVLTRSSDFTTKRVQAQRIGSIFAQQNADTRLDNMRTRLKNCPKYDLDFIQSAVSSMSAALPLCKAGFEKTLVLALLEAFESFTGSSFDAYSKYLDIDKLIIAMDHDELIELLNPVNTTCQIILAHIVALHLVMRPISCNERKQYTVTMYSIRMSSWIPAICESLDPKYREYISWPAFIGKMHVAGQLEKYTLEGRSRKSQKELEGILETG